ncbi:MAG: cob(I)yrinic acid a,c-diamide adenosyltransferase [Spirochaetota bacterium]
MKGYVQVYTGNGKGKTTAALGQALRAAGGGLRVFIAQFLKGIHYSELDSLKRFEDLITVRQYGKKGFVKNHPAARDKHLALQGLEEAKQAVISGNYDMVVLDEANVAVHMGLFPVEKLLEIIDQKPRHVELIITGRNAHNQLIARADLVTEMKEVKHYFHNGVKARRGIER